MNGRRDYYIQRRYRHAVYSQDVLVMPLELMGKSLKLISPIGILKFNLTASRLGVLEGDNPGFTIVN